MGERTRARKQSVEERSAAKPVQASLGARRDELDNQKMLFITGWQDRTHSYL